MKVTLIVLNSQEAFLPRARVLVMEITYAEMLHEAHQYIALFEDSLIIAIVA